MKGWQTQCLTRLILGMLRLLLFVFALLFTLVQTQAQSMRIGIFTEANLKTIQFTAARGNVFLLNDGEFFQEIEEGDIINITMGISKKLDVKINGTYVLSGGKIQLIQEKEENFLKVKPVNPNLQERSYEGDFELTNNGTKITLVNVVDMEVYLEGVVESESGSGQNVEYYQAQAIISRTYAMKYVNKHASEGYNLCERVHCQAYLHKRLNAAIIDTAVRKSAGKVMVDKKNQLYATYFHANCGGQTCEPDQVWNERLDGFESFRDTFCIRTKQANWEKRIPKQEWTSFMVNKYNFPLNDSLSQHQLYNFQQPYRYGFFIHPSYGIPLRDIREAFQLKSTLFNVSLEGEMVVLKGKGFGHGVGLCQEGAMNMSKKGYDHRQILEYYYPSMRLVKDYVPRKK